MADTLPPTDELYRAVTRRDRNYEGVFFTGVRTTGVFCRPGCPARTPRRENVEFFRTAAEALAAGYRPCRRCRPMEPAGEPPGALRALLETIDQDPLTRIRDADLRARRLSPEAVRRWFKRHHGITFQAYQRARRLGRALGRIRQGDRVSTTTYDTGFESESGFRDACLRLFGAPPSRAARRRRVYVARLLTPLGPMLGGAVEEGVCLFEFGDRPMLETQLKRVVRIFDADILPEPHPHIAALETQVAQYFAGERETFDLPLQLQGTDFQQACWRYLLAIPFGETRSYDQEARAIGRAGAYRAVGRANGDNRMAIIVPCHRVVRSDGQLAGYGGGKWRKEWLLAHERRAQLTMALPEARPRPLSRLA